MNFVSQMEFSSASNSVVVGAGAMWSDLIKYLNRFGKAPRTLQSYASFSVGGTISVNGHGITTDFCFAESVLSVTLVRSDGEVIKCARDSAVVEHRELFKLCIGGYGLFGVIYDVVLKCNDNTRLSMDAMTVPIRDFTYVYDSVLKSSDEVEMKLARIDTTTFETVDVFVFRRATAPGTYTGMCTHIALTP